MVADVDADLEGQAETGSVEVEERNLLARTTVAARRRRVAVGLPGLKGLHALVRVVDDLRDHGVDPRRILAVVNRVGRNQRAKAELRRTFAALTGDARPWAGGPVFLPERRGLDDLHRDGARLPGSLTGPLVGRGRARSSTAPGPRRARTGMEPTPVTPGIARVVGRRGGRVTSHPTAP